MKSKNSERQLDREQQSSAAVQESIVELNQLSFEEVKSSTNEI